MNVNTQNLAWDIGITVGEIVVLVVMFLVLNFLIQRVFRRVVELRWLQNQKTRVEGLRRNFKVFLALLCAGLCLAAIGFNGYLIWQGKSVRDQAQEWLAELTLAFWLNLGTEAAELIGLAIAAMLVIRWLRRLLWYLQERAKAWEQIKANDQSIEAFFGALIRIQTVSLWLLALYFATRLLPLLPVVAEGVLLVLKIFLIVTLGLLVSNAVSAIVASLDALSVKYSSPDNFLRFYDQLRGLVPLARRCLEWVVYVYVATLVVMQLKFISHFAVHGPQAVKIIGIFFSSRVVVELANLIVDSSVIKVDHLTQAEQQRRRTLVPLIKSILGYLIYFAAFVMMLSVLKVNLAPILAGAGVVGLVVGLGAQSVVNDVVTGFFIIFENHFMVGDFIETGHARGVVEAIEIRTTRIRDPGGQQHILRNGQIGEVVNFSKGYTRAVVDVGVAYDSDLDKVYRVLRQTGQELKETNTNVLEPTKVNGLDNFGESDLTIRTVTQVQPGHHLDVARDLRKRIKEAFDREGIEIPFARRVLIFKPEQAKPLERAAGILPAERTEK